MGFSLDEYIKGKRKEQGERIATEPSAPRNDDLGQGMGKSTGGGFSLDAYMKEKSGGAKTSGPVSFRESIQPSDRRGQRDPAQGQGWAGLEPAPTQTPTTKKMSEEEELRAESRYRTQLAKGTTAEELAVKAAVRDAGFRAGRLGGEVEELEKRGQQLLLQQQELTGQDAAELPQQIMENGRALEEKRAERRRAGEEKEALTTLLTPPKSSPYRDLSAQQLRTLQEHAEISLRMAEKALEEAGLEAAGADSENIPEWARPSVTGGATARGAYTPRTEYSGEDKEKVRGLIAERDRWRGVVNDVGAEFYYRENEEQATKLAGDAEGQARFQAVEDILADLRTLGAVAAGETEDGESVRTREALRAKYGLTERELEVKATELMTQLQGELERAKEAVGAAGYDYDKMTAYQERLARNARAMEGQRKTVEYAHEHPGWASVESTLAAPAQAFDYIGMALKGFGHSDPTDLDNYIPANAYDAKATNFVRNVRGTVAADLAEKYGFEIGGTNIAAFLYQTGMSMSDFLYNAMLTGNFTGGWGAGTELGKKAAENLSLAIMGSGAAANTTVEAIERGLSNRQAFALGAIAGIAEIVTEKVSLETLLDKTAMDKSAWGYICKNILAEGSEEVASDLINWAGDVLVSRDRSQWAQAIQRYMDQGMDEKEAFREALKDQVVSMGWSGLGGGLSGGLMAGSGVAVNQVMNWADGGVDGRAHDVRPYEEQGQVGPRESGPQILWGEEAGRFGTGPYEGLDGQVQSVMEALVEQGDGRTDVGKVMEALQKLSPAERDGAALWDAYGRLMETEFTVDEEGSIVRRERGGVSVDEEAGRFGTGPYKGTVEWDPELGWQQLGMLERNKESFGSSGQKALTAFWEQGGDPAAYYGGFAAYYDAGVAGIAQEKVQSPYAGSMTEVQKYAAYAAGQNDAAASLAEQKRAAEFASVAGKDSGLVYDDYVRENLDVKDFKLLNTVLKKLEARARFVDMVGDGKADGAIAPGDSDILLSKDMTEQEIILKVIGHEMGHRVQDLAPEAYRTLREAVVQELGEEELSIRMEEMFRRYEKEGLERTSEQILDEVTADRIGEMVRDRNALEAFVEANQAPEKRSVLEWLRDAIRGLIRKLTGKETQEEVRQLTQAERRLTAALTAAEKQAAKLAQQSGGEKTAAPVGDGGKRFAIRHDKDGFIAVLEEKVSGERKAVLSYLKSLVSDETFSKVLSDAQEIYVGKDLPGEYTQSEYTKGLFRDLRAAKFKAARILNDMLLIAEDVKWKEDKNGKHGDAAKNGWYYYKSRFAIPVLKLSGEISHYNTYNATLLVRNDTDGKSYLYDIKIQKMLSTIAADGFTEPAIYSRAPSDKTSVSQDSGEVKGRYSLKSGDGLREMVELRRENERLKGQVEYWRRQTRLTTVLTPQTGDVKRVAGELVRKYQSTLKAEDLTAGITEIWRGLNDKRNSYEAVKELARPLARKLVESATAEMEGVGKDYRDAAEYLKKTKIQVPKEIWSELESKGGYGEFRRENFGRLKLSSKEGTPIDTAYKEMAQMWPGLFDETAYSAQGDQLAHMAQVAEMLQPVWENPYKDILDAAVDEAATDILAAAMDGNIARMPETMADRMARKVRESREEHWEGRKKDAARITEAYREIRKRDVEQLTRHFREMDAKKAERREKTETRTRIYKIANELTRRVLKPTDTKHVPQDFRRPLAALLATIDLGSGYDMNFARSGSYERVARDSVLGAEKTVKTVKFEQVQTELAKLGGGSTRGQALAELQKLLSRDGELTVDPDLVGTDGWIGQMEAMGDKSVDEMTGEELKVVNKAMAAIAQVVSEENNMLTGSRWKKVSEAAEEIRRENRGKKDRTKWTGVWGKAQDMVMDMLTPEAYFHRLGKGGDELFRQLRKAQDKQIVILNEVAESTRKSLENYDVKKAEETIYDVGGVKVSTAQIINLYNLSRRKQALDHIGKGGVKPEGAVEKGKTLTYAEPIRDGSLQWVGEAISRLTEEDIRAAKAMQEIMAGPLAQYGNEASMAVFGYQKFEEADYWPIKVNSNELQQSVEQKTKVKTPANYGMTKQTQPQAANSVKLGSAFDVFAEHITEMSTYAAFLGVMEDLRRIRNYQFRVQREDGSWEHTGENMGSLIERVMGTDGKSYWDNLMTQLAVGVKGQKVGRSYTGRLLGNFKASAIGANLRVVIQQPTAILRAADMIDPKYLTKGAAHPMEGWKKAVEYAPIARWKDWGYFDVVAGRQIKDVMFDTDAGTQKLTNTLMAPAGWADSFAWGQLWNAVEMETRAKHRDLKVGSAEYYDHVADRFAAIIDHSQVVDGILQRSQMMRDPDGLAKMATSFMAEPMKQANMVMTAVYDLRNAGDPAARMAAKKRLVRTGFAMGACIVVNAAAKSIVDAARGAKDDREKEYWERWLEAVGENLVDDINPISYVPYAKDVLSLFQGYDVKRTDMQVMADLVDGIKAVVKALKGEGKRTVLDAGTDFAAALASVMGLPVGNVKRGILSLVNSAAVDLKNYVWQYEVEKWVYRPTENKTRNMDLLWTAFRGDMEQYQILRGKLLEDGIEEDYIESGMLTRAAKELDVLRVTEPGEYNRLYQECVRNGIPKEKMRTRLENMRKKAEGVDSAEDLSSRYLMPDQETIYDAAIRKIQETDIWRQATGEQRKDAEADLFAIASGSKSGEKILEKTEAYGVDETEYILYQLALSMVDKPNASGKLGTYTNDEVEEAILRLEWLTDAERSAMWLAAGKQEKSNPWN